MWNKYLVPVFVLFVGTVTKLTRRRIGKAKCQQCNHVEKLVLQSLLAHPQCFTMNVFLKRLPTPPTPQPSDSAAFLHTPDFPTMGRADLATRAVKVDHLDAVVVGVHPIENALWDVQTQAVGPQHRFAGQEHISVGAIHPGPLNFASLALLRVFLPVSPVHPPVGTAGELSYMFIEKQSGRTMLIIPLMYLKYQSFNQL